MLKKYSALIFFMLLFGSLAAQIDEDDDIRQNQTVRDTTRKSVRDGKGPNVVAKDTIGIRIKSINITEFGLKMKNALLDTVAHNIHLFYPYQTTDYSAAFLGNVGQPAFPSNFYYRQFDNRFLFSTVTATNFTLNDALYFDTSRPFTSIYHGTGSKSLNEQILRIIQTFNLNPFFNFTLQYNLNLSQGQYQFQKGVNHHFIASVNYTLPYYRGYYTFLSNKNELEENGGIAEDIPFMDTEILPVYLEDASSKYRDFEGRLIHEIPFKPLRNDSMYLGTNRFSIVVTNTIKEMYRNYTDKNTGTFYKNEYLKKGASADSVYFNSIVNSAAFKVADSTYEISGGAKFEMLKYYNYHDFLVLDNFASAGNLALYASAKLGNDTTYLHAQTEFYFSGYNASDYNLNVNGNLRLLKKLNLSVFAKLELFKQTPQQILQRYTSNRIKWNNSFEAESGIRANAGISFFKNSKLGLQFSSIQNAIYFDKNALPNQSENPFTVTSFYTENYIDFWFMYLRLNAYYQRYDQTLPLNLPNYAGMGSFGFRFYFFKVTDMRIGVDAYYNKPHAMPNYFPATGMFYLNENKYSINYPLADLVLSGTFKKSTFYLKLENVTSYIYTDKYYNVVGYPRDLFTVKYGVRWTFND